MSGQKDVMVVGATRIAVGPSAIIRVQPLPNQVSWMARVISGGTLEIVQPNTTPAGWGSGFPFAVGDLVPIEGPAAFYLTAAGATAVVACMYKYSYGATAV